MSDETAVVSWKETLKAEAKAVTAVEHASGSKISLRSGVLSYLGTPVPDNKLDVVILDFAYEATYYEGSWDPESPENPRCFAISRIPQDQEMAWPIPHETIPEPMSQTCLECPKNEWGSDFKDGKARRGKACKEKRRLVVIPASSLKSVEEVLAAEVATLSVPVTSVKRWQKFCSDIDSLYERPPFGVLTQLSTKPNPKNQFDLIFTVIGTIDDSNIGMAVMKKRKAAESALLEPFGVNTEIGEEAPVKIVLETKPSKAKKF